MWFSKRGSKNYRSQNGEHCKIGYAESEDGLNWERLDQKAGINKSNTGWDSEMIEYASVYKILKNICFTMVMVLENLVLVMQKPNKIKMHL